MSKLISAWLIIIVGCVAIFSCADGNESPVILEGVIIKTGQLCGWCGGADSLTLTEAKSYYEYYPACAGQNKYKESDTERWSELLAKFDWDKFMAVNVNTCFVCADGCDTWISIQKDGVTHQIRFGDNSAEIEPIRSFVEELQARRIEFKNN